MINSIVFSHYVYRCVKSSYVTYTGQYQRIWKDSGSGAHRDVSLWANTNVGSSDGIFANAYTSVATHSQPNGNPPLLSNTVARPHFAIPSYVTETEKQFLLSAYPYLPIFKFDRAGECYPDWPSQENDNTCVINLNVDGPVFVQQDTCGAYTVYTYWLWYGKQEACIEYFDEGHGNDWEHVSVFVNSDGTVASIVFHQHSGHYTRQWGTFESIGTRPAVYVGKTSHGSYHTYCTGECSFTEFITGGCFGSVNYCVGGCPYWDDYRNPAGPDDSLDSPVLHPLRRGQTIDGIKRRDSNVCDDGTCAGADYRSLFESGCWQDEP